MFVKSPIKQQTYESEELLHKAMSQTSLKSSKKMKSNSSDGDSVGESDSSTTISVKGSGNTGQRVFRWSKFVRNLYEMAINPMNARAVGFSPDGLCLEVRDAKLLSSDVLQKYFKHKNVSSFIRQLNNYGFKTVPVIMNSAVSHCFAHDCFQQDRLDLLEGVTRRTAGSDAQKIGERISALREKESEFEERMEQLQRHNEELKRHNSELMEENKRLRSNWMAVQDTLKSRLYEQQPPSQHQHQHHQQQVQQQYHQQQSRAHRNMPPPPAQISEQTMGFGFEPNAQEIFMLPTFPALFPEEF